MKTVVITLLLLALGAGGYFVWKKYAPDKRADEEISERATTAEVMSRDIKFAINVAGEIAPAEQVSVRPEISGKIASLPVDIGDRVKKGQVLFTLDDKELQNQKAASQTEIERARLQLEQSQRNHTRNQQLHEEKLIPQELYETSRTELELSRNALTRSERELAVVEERLTKTVIVAPFDCTVLTRPISVGQAVSGSSGVAGGTEVLTVADLNQMIINSHVNQADVTRLRVGLQVDVSVEAVPGLHVVATVDRIAPQATIRNNIKGFSTRMALAEIDPRIQPGMTANVTIPVASAEDVLAVPLGAVFFAEDGERYVYVKKALQYERRAVKIGLADYFYAEVISGLAEGDVVALEQPGSELVIGGDPGGKMKSIASDGPGAPREGRAAEAPAASGTRSNRVGTASRPRSSGGT